MDVPCYYYFILFFIIIIVSQLNRVFLFFFSSPHQHLVDQIASNKNHTYIHKYLYAMFSHIFSCAHVFVCVTLLVSTPQGAGSSCIRSQDTLHILLNLSIWIWIWILLLFIRMVFIMIIIIMRNWLWFYFCYKLCKLLFYYFSSFFSFFFGYYFRVRSTHSTFMQLNLTHRRRTIFYVNILAQKMEPIPTRKKAWIMVGIGLKNWLHW